MYACICRVGFLRGASFLPAIRDTKFSALQILYLYNLELDTVESLCRVYWPQLEELSLSENRIINLSSLRKMDTMKLC